MSAAKDGDLFQKLNLFESTSVHAWINWDNPQIIRVEKSTCKDVLSIGEHDLKDIADESQQKKLLEYHKAISESISHLDFVIKNHGQDCEVKCVSLIYKDRVISLWYMAPEKDNSIFYLQNAAHDFRSPLASIMGAVNLMQHAINSNKELDQSEIVTLLEMIKLNTDKSLSLADEIMELAEIESENYKLETTPVVMNDFVSNYLATHRLMTLKKRIDVVFDSQTNIQVRINEAKLTRAIDNVLTNAVKFSRPGSQITFNLVETKEKVILAIMDQGIGMSEKILKSVFVKFGASKRQGLDGEPTHGLGMSIVKQIMHLHGGEVQVESVEGKGTTVRLILTKEL